MPKLDNVYFENIICHNAYINSEFLTSIVDHYKPEYFSNNDIRIFMNILVDFFTRRNTIPTPTEMNALLVNDADRKAFISVLKIFKTLDNNYNMDELYVNTEQFLREKAVYNALVSTTEYLTKNKDINTDEIFTKFQDACNISLIDNLGCDYFSEINKLCDTFIRPSNTISTGWKWLDNKLGGGWQAEGKALYVFTGFTNVGKSIFLGNVAVNLLKQNKTVVLITLEMPESLYAKRITANLTGKSFTNMPQYIDDVKASLYNFTNEHKSRLIIKEFPTGGMTINHMNSFIQKLIKKGIKPDAIVVDYLSLMKNQHAQKAYNSYEKNKDISEQLRASTYMFNAPLITAAQLNRKGAGVEEPGMETISESIGVSFTADGQFSIWSDENDKKIGIIHLGIQKNRFGENYGATQLKIDYNTLTLSEMPQNVTMISNQSMQTDTGDAEGALETLSSTINKTGSI